MPRALAVNAIMIYADRPAELARWYYEHLGIRAVLNPADSCYYGELGTWGDGSPVHFGIYPAPAPLGDSQRSVMINYRVDDLPAAIEELQAKGVAIEDRVTEDYGEFAHLRDAEGNLIELWMSRARKHE
jgi:predicted enzyme related to lactoylglutathione lyase